MRTWKPIFRTLTILIVVLMISGMASASPLAVVSPGTAFTYQGRLSEGGSPANGVYPFQFKLFDALTGGTQKGSTITFMDQTVTNGLFTVSLDFGDVFDGTPLFLEVGVGVLVAGSYVFTPLDPRQALTPTPYAIYASKVPWSGITGKPGNVIVVAKTGGDFTSIQAALNSIVDASDTNRYLIYVAPGVYTELVGMKQYVDIQGSGELTTKITSDSGLGTVQGSNNAEVRFLTVETTSSSTNAYAFASFGMSPRLTHITAIASGGTNNIGVFNGGNSATLTNVTASASGGTNSYGVYNDSGSATMTDVNASASGGTNNYGVYNNTGSPTMTNVNASASGGTTNCGVYNNTGSPTMTNVNASASGGTWNSGVKNTSSTPTMIRVTARASGGNGSYGVYNDSSSPIMTEVTAFASDGLNNSGVYNLSSSSPTMTSVTATASGGSNTYGVYNSISSSPTMANVTAKASDGSTNNYGIYISNSSPTMTNVTATVSGGSNKYGVYSANSSSPKMTNLAVTVWGGGLNYGVYNDSSSPTINNSVINSLDYGIYNSAASGTYTVVVNNSQIIGTINTIRSVTGFTTNVGNSQLSGGAISLGGGTVSCIGVYDKNFANALGYTFCP
jgi:hypothetical protein